VTACCWIWSRPTGASSWRLDLRKGAIYHYFPSKAHLLYSIFDRAITTALTLLEEV